MRIKVSKADKTKHFKKPKTFFMLKAVTWRKFKSKKSYLSYLSSEVWNLFFVLPVFAHLPQRYLYSDFS